MFMKKIGLIGGMSWESTLPYYKIINETINKEKGDLYSADCILHSVNFQEVESTISKGDWSVSNYLLSNAALGLEREKVDFIAICSNTMHKCIPAIRERTNIEILHIVDATSKRMKMFKIKSALLLGTRFTMEEEFNKERFIKNGINVIVPNLQDRQTIHDIIFKELCKGVIKKESQEIYSKIIYKYCPSQAEAVILGCTEIGLLIKPDDIRIPVFDTTIIHAEEIALYAIK